MRTVLRLGEGNEITHIHYARELYLPKDQYDTVTETEITPEMVDTYLKDSKPSDVISQLVNGELTTTTLKLALLVKAGVKITPHFHNGN